MPVGAAVSVTKALPGPAPQPLPSRLLLPPRDPLPFLHGFPGSGQKAAPRARRGLRKHSRFRTVEPRRALRSPLGRAFYFFCRPGGHGAGVPGRAKLLLHFAEGAGALPPRVRLFPGKGGGVSAAQAQRFPRPEAERLRGFVAGKSAWEQRSVWPIADRCPSPDTHVVLPPQPTPLLPPAPTLELPCADRPLGAPWRVRPST